MDDEGGFIIYLGPRELGEAYEAHREVHYAPDLYPQHGAQYEEAHANARLLAASRDLLEAVEAMLFEHCGAKVDSDGIHAGNFDCEMGRQMRFRLAVAIARGHIDA